VVTGATITSGQGTTSIVVSFPNNYLSATVKVQSLGTCSASAYNTAVTVVPIPTLEFTGGTFFGYCGATRGIKFSVNTIASATNYKWTVPSRVTITAGQGTSTITVDFSAGFSSGTIKVFATNVCGNSNALSATVKAVPQAPVSITGSAAVCPASINAYSTSPVGGASSYSWTIPSGWTLLSGQGTTSISVRSTNAGGTIKVAAVNACGAGAAVSKTVSIATCKEGVAEAVLTEQVSAGDGNRFVVFPNPAEQEVNLSYSFTEAGTVNTLFYDLNGKAVYQETSEYQQAGTSSQKSIDINLLPDGIYMVQVSCNQVMMRKRLVVAH
jgi:hypothetical protein